MIRYGSWDVPAPQPVFSQSFNTRLVPSAQLGENVVSQEHGTNSCFRFFFFFPLCSAPPWPQTWAPKRAFCIEISMCVFFFFLIVALCLELWFYCYKIQSHNFLKLGFSFPTMTNIHNTNHDIFSMCIIKTYKDKEKKVVNPIKEHCMFIIFTNDTAFI